MSGRIGPPVPGILRECRWYQSGVAKNNSESEKSHRAPPCAGESQINPTTIALAACRRGGAWRSRAIRYQQAFLLRFESFCSLTDERDNSWEKETAPSARVSSTFALRRDDGVKLLD